MGRGSECRNRIQVGYDGLGVSGTEVSIRGSSVVSKRAKSSSVEYSLLSLWEQVDAERVLSSPVPKTSRFKFLQPRERRMAYVG